jgi:uncharacterized protein YjeT (DUF2065 family)
MADVHLPRLEEHDEHDEPAEGPAARRLAAPSLLKIALEVVLIGTGVFLGLAGEQWRESARHRDLAEASLRRFRTEIHRNQTAVGAVKDYHATTRKDIDAYLATALAARHRDDLRINGIKPVFFEHSAWDLAMATQSLNYLDSQLAFAIARVYNRQQAYAELTHDIMQTMYLRPPNEDLDPFLRSLSVYYGDVVLMEPELVRMYDDLLPQIDRALGDSFDQKAQSR